jgi:hypothetical protein
MHQIKIKVEGIERRKRSTGVLHIIAGLVLLTNANRYYKLLGYEHLTNVLPAFLIGLASILYGSLRKRIDPSAHYNHWMRMLQFLMFAVLGIFMQKGALTFGNSILFLWAVICICLLFTERKIFHDASLVFGPTNVSVPGYFSTHVIPWNRIENVVVRPDFVTIQYLNNKDVQYEMLRPIASSEIDIINHFCAKQIHSAGTVSSS